MGIAVTNNRVFVDGVEIIQREAAPESQLGRVTKMEKENRSVSGEVGQTHSEAKPVLSVVQGYPQGKLDLNHPVLSQSFQNSWEFCAFAAFMSYVKGIKIPPTGKMTSGSALDTAVTHGVNHVIQTGEDAKLSEKKEAASAKFDKEAPDTDFQDEDAGSVKDRTIGMVELHHEMVAPRLQPVSAQENIRVSFDEFDLAGTIDIVEKDKKKGIILTDTKSTGKKNSHTMHANVQAAMYSLLYEVKHGVPAKRFRFDVMIGYKSRAAEYEPVEGPVTSQDHSLLMYRIQASLHELQLSLKTGIFRLAPQGSYRCHESGKYCGYLYNGCPKGKKL